MLEPQVASLGIDRNLIIAFKVGGIQTIGIELIHFRQQLPGKINRFFLEVISERPRPQHLEKSVMVRISSHIFQIVVLSARTDALLGVGTPLQGGHGRVRIRLTKEYRLELIHTGICKQERGVVERDTRRAWDERM